MIQRLREEPWAAPTVFLCSLFGPWHTWMGILLALILTDYASGVLAACVRGQVDSNIAKIGVYKKLGMGLAVVLAHQFDRFTSAGDAWVKTVLALLIASEGWSIIENLDDIGVPMPQSLRDRVQQLRENNPRKRSRREVKKKGGDINNENQGQDS